MKDYSKKLSDVMIEAINYAYEFGIKLNFLPSSEAINIYHSEPYNNECDIYFNVARFCEQIDYLEIDDAIIQIYNTIFEQVAFIISDVFSKCKKIKKLVNDESEMYLFAASFCEKYSNINETQSQLRAELDLTNKIWQLYKVEKDKFAQA